MQRKERLGLWLLPGLAVLLVVAGACKGSGKNVNPEGVAMDFAVALLQGDVDVAGQFVAEDATGKVLPKLDEVAAIVAQYETDEYEVGSTRPSRPSAGSSGKRVEIRFTYRQLGAQDEPRSIGVVGIIVEVNGGLYQVSDVTLEKPRE